MNRSSSSAARLGIVALLSFSTAAFVACSSTETSPTSTSSTSSGSGGGSTGTGGSGGTSTSASTSTGTGGSLTPAAQVAKLCDDIVAPYCEAILACCTDPSTITNVGGTVDGCKTKFSADCAKDIGEGIVEQAEAGNTVLDQARLAACVASLEGMKAGGASCSRPPTFVVLLDCVTAFQGTLAPGAACDATNLHDNEFIPCKEGVCDNGKCAAFLATGAACDPSKGLFAAGGCNYIKGELCFGAGATGKCAPQGAIGAACANPGKDKSFDCKSMSCGPTGTCIAPTVNGVCSSG
jgi:hypothetical protein